MRARSDRRWLLPVSFFLAASVMSAAPREAFGQSQGQLLVAQGWFDEGLSLERAGKWSEALAKFKNVADVKRTSQVQFHIGLCESKAGLLADAAVDLTRAMEMAKADNKPDVQKAAEDELKEVRPRVPTLEIAAPGGHTPTKVLLDKQPLALSVLGTAIPVNPGQHEITLEFDKGATSTKSVTVAEKEAQKVQMDAPTAPIVVPPPPDKETKKSNVLPWTLVAVGGVSLIASGVFFLRAFDNLDALEQRCPNRQCPDTPENRAFVDDEEGKGKTNMLLADIFLGVGIAGVGAGVALLVLNGKSSTTTGRAPLVTPVALPGGGGALLRTTF